jgi:hypothetical protein
MERWVRSVVLVVGMLAIGACSAGAPAATGGGDDRPATTGASGSTAIADGTTVPTTSGSSAPADDQRWGTCRTRIAYQRFGDLLESADAAERAAGLDGLRALPPPDDAEAWSTFMAYAERYVEVGATFVPTRPGVTGFQDGLAERMEREPTVKALFGLGQARGSRLVALGAEQPCDPEGMPDGFGCPDPTSCSQAWAEAAHAHDAGALELLNQDDRTGDLTPSASLDELTCADSELGFVQVVECTGQMTAGTNPVNRYRITWAPIADGRWYGVGVEASTFVPVATAVP